MQSARPILSAALVLTSVIVLGVPSSVSAAGKAQSTAGVYSAFIQCPVDAKVGPKEPVTICVTSTAAAGYFVINNTIIPFAGPGIVQGGFDGNLTGPSWADALNGVSFSAPPQPFPGGVGALLGNPQLTGKVSVVGEVAGPLAFNFNCIFSNCTVLTVPVKFHLVNPNLGKNCYIGSTTSPMTLNLTPGTTNPPPPNNPISGSLGRLTAFDHGNVLVASGAVFVDNAFAVPAATGCGSFGSLDSQINNAQGLPAAAGLNTVVFVGDVDLGVASAVERHLGG